MTFLVKIELLHALYKCVYSNEVILLVTKS